MFRKDLAHKTANARQENARPQLGYGHLFSQVRKERRITSASYYVLLLHFAFAFNSCDQSDNVYTNLDGKLALVGSWIWVGLLSDEGHPA